MSASPIESKEINVVSDISDKSNLRRVMTEDLPQERALDVMFRAFENAVPNNALCDMASAIPRLQGYKWSCSGGQPSTDQCSWKGVTCTMKNSQNVVTEIYLPMYDLEGSLPTSIGYLTALTRLNLNDNSLTGPLPTTIGYLTALQTLWLSINSLSQVIPTSIGYMTSLTSLKLTSNQLTGVLPTSLGLLTRLNALYLTKNSISGGIPTSLGFLTSLTQLFLGYNSLAGVLPDSLGYIHGLEHLELSSNCLSGSIPSTFGDITGLAALDVTQNSLGGSVPGTLCTNKGLVAFVEGNKLSCYDSCFWKTAKYYSSDFDSCINAQTFPCYDFLYDLSACYTAADFRISKSISGTYSTCPNIKKASTVENYCEFFNKNNCVKDSQIVFDESINCPPKCLRGSPDMYCQTYSQLYFACGGDTKAVGSDDQVRSLEQGCLDTYSSQTPSTATTSSLNVQDAIAVEEDTATTAVLAPSKAPTRRPTTKPSRRPTRKPSTNPSRKGSSRPSAKPSRAPTGKPVNRPTSKPSVRPSRSPSSSPSARPSMRPSSPSVQPTYYPTRPTTLPTALVSNYIAVNFSFTLENIDQDILNAHKTGSDKSAYVRDKEMIKTALSGASGLSSSTFNTSNMDINSDIVLRRHRGSSTLSGKGAAVVRMQGRIFAKALNSSIESSEDAIIQFQRMVTEALSGGSNSDFLNLLKDKYIDGTNLDNYKTTDGTNIVKVKIFTSTTGNSAVTDIDGYVEGSAPTSAPM